MRRILATALVLVACGAPPAPRTVTPSAARTAAVSPTAAVSLLSPTPSSTPFSVPQNVRLGLVLSDPGPPFVVRLRTEADPAVFATLNGTGAAVSPDGIRMAYWHREPGASATQDSLRVVDLFTGTETEFAKLANEIPVGIAWRDDGGGLLFASRSPSISGGGADPPPLFTVVRLYFFTTKEVRELKRLGAVRFLPLSWSLAAHVVSGVDAGEGEVQSVYRFKEDGTSAGDTPGETRFSQISDTSRDARFILGQWAFFSGGRSSSGIRVVSAVDAKPIAEVEAADGAFLLRARFRPGATDAVVLLRAGEPQRYVLELWTTTAATPTRRTIWTGPAAPFSSGDLVMRADGNAAYVRTDTAAPGTSTWTIVELESGRATPLASSTSAVPGGPSFFTTDEGIAKLKKP